MVTHPRKCCFLKFRVLEVHRHHPCPGPAPQKRKEENAALLGGTPCPKPEAHVDRKSHDLKAVVAEKANFFSTPK